MLDPGREAWVFPAGRPIPELVAGLNEYQPDRLVGYASIVQELCVEALDGRLKIRPRRISTNSEPLLDETRAWRLRRGASTSIIPGDRSGAIVTVEPVTELPRHPDTHKLKRFVPLS
jgi:hypothetical protein